MDCFWELPRYILQGNLNCAGDNFLGLVNPEGVALLLAEGMHSEWMAAKLLFGFMNNNDCFVKQSCTLSITLQQQRDHHTNDDAGFWAAVNADVLQHQAEQDRLRRERRMRRIQRDEGSDYEPDSAPEDSSDSEEDSSDSEDSDSSNSKDSSDSEDSNNSDHEEDSSKNNSNGEKKVCVCVCVCVWMLLMHAAAVCGWFVF
jgi:hypothetical protein